MPFRDASANGGRIRLKHSMTSDEAITADGLHPGELALQAADGRLLYRDSSGAVSGFPGSDDIHKIVALTQAEYDAITPDSTTLYVIT